MFTSDYNSSVVTSYSFVPTVVGNSRWILLHQVTVNNWESSFADCHTVVAIWVSSSYSTDGFHIPFDDEGIETLAAVAWVHLGGWGHDFSIFYNLGTLDNSHPSIDMLMLKLSPTLSVHREHGSREQQNTGKHRDLHV